MTANWPTSQDYNEAIQNAATSLNDPDLRRGEATVNAMGLPVPRSGNFADVYRFTGAGGRVWALKLFTRKVAGLQERYARIGEHLARARLPFTVGFEYQEKGVRVQGGWYPLLKMEWVEGYTLNDFVSRNLDRPQHLHALLQMWAKLAGRLRDADMAHADLQHGNVLLVPGSTPTKLGLKLIDYDGMWVPALSGTPSGELGHANFQHPLRLRDRLYNGDVDRFPHLVIAAGLRAALLGRKAFWDRFDNGDNLLFREKDLQDPAGSALFKSLWALNDRPLDALIGHMVLSVGQPLRKTPWLDDILLDEKGPALSREQSDQVAAMLGVPPRPAPVPVMAGAALPTEEFSDFAFLDEPEPIASVARRPAKAGAGKAAKKSRTPLLVGGLLALAAVGGVVALTAGGKKGVAPVEVAKADPAEHEPVVQPAVEPKAAEPKAEPKPPPKKELTKEVVPALAAPKTPVIAVAALATPPGAYVYACQDDPILYLSRGPGQPRQEVGRSESPVRALAVARDGSKAVVGTEDGSVRVWSMKPAPSRADMKRRIAAFQGIDTGSQKWSMDVFEEGVVLRNAAGKEALIFAGRPGQVVKDLFKRLRDDKPKMREQLGEAVSPETRVFNDALVVQIYQGGAFLYDFATRRWWYGAHQRRVAEPFAPDAAESPRPPKEHATAVIACAVSPDATAAVTVGQDGKVCEWNLARGALVRTFDAPGTLAAAYLPDGKQVLLAGQDGQAGIWELKRQRRVTELKGHTGPVRAACVHPSGALAYTGGEDGTVRFWDALTGGQRESAEFHKGGVLALSLSVDGRLLASSGADRAVRFCDAVSAKPVGTPVDGVKPTVGLAFVGDGRELVAAMDGDRDPAIIQRPESAVAAAAEAPRSGPFTPLEIEDLAGGAPNRVGYNAEGDLLYVAGKGGVAVVDGTSGKELKRLPLDSPVRDAAFGPGKQLYVATADGRFECWDWDTGKRVHEAVKDKKALPVSEVCETGDPKRLLLLTDSPVVLLWDTRSWKEAGRLTPAAEQTCAQASVYPGGKQAVLLLKGKDARLVVWDLLKNRQSFALEPAPISDFYLGGVSPNGKWIVGCCRDNGGQVHVWDASNGKLQRSYTGLAAARQSGGFTAGGNCFVVCEPGGHRHVVDMAAGTMSDESGPNLDAAAAATAPANNLLASVSAGGRLRLWRIGTDEEAAVAVRPPDPKGVAVRPADPKPAPAAEGKDGLVKKSAPLGERPTLCHFSGDGKKLYVAAGGTVHVLDSASLQTLEKQAVGKGRILYMEVVAKNTSLSGVTTPERLYVLEDSRHVRIWDPVKGAELKDINLEKILPERGAFSLSVSPDGNTVVVSDGNRDRSYFHDVRKNVEAIPAILQNAAFARGTRSVFFSPDGRIAAATGYDTLLVWNPRAGREISSGETRPFLRLVGLIPDAGAVAAARYDRLYVWHYANGKEMSNFEPHGGDPYLAAPMPRGAGIVTAGSDRTVRVYDVRTGTEVAKWKSDDYPQSVAVSPDAKFAVTTHGFSEQVCLWSLPQFGGKKP